MATPPDIQLYADPVAFLEAWLAWRRAGPGGISWARLAHELGERSRSTVPDILRRRRPLLPEQARRWASVFGFADGGARFVSLAEREAWRRRARAASESAAARLNQRYAGDQVARLEARLEAGLVRRTETAAADAPRGLALEIAPNPVPAGRPRRGAPLAHARAAAQALDAEFARVPEGTVPKIACIAAVIGLDREGRAALDAELVAMADDARGITTGEGGPWLFHAAAFRVSERLDAPPRPLRPVGAPPASAAAFIAQWLDWRAEVEPGYRSTHLAREAGFEDTKLVWKLVHGTRRVTPPLAAHLAEAMALEPEERDLLVTLAVRDGATGPARAAAGALADGLQAVSAARHVRDRRLRHLSGWQPLAIHELAGALPQPPDPARIAALLRPRAATDDVTRALSELAEGQVFDEEGRPLIIGSGPGTRAYYRAVKRLELEILEWHGDPVEGLDSFFGLRLPALDPAATMAWIRAWWHRLMVATEGRQASPEHIFQLTIDVLPLAP